MEREFEFFSFLEPKDMLTRKQTNLKYNSILLQSTGSDSDGAIRTKLNIDYYHHFQNKLHVYEETATSRIRYTFTKKLDLMYII